VTIQIIAANVTDADFNEIDKLFQHLPRFNRQFSDRHGVPFACSCAK
jgi:hypothetical protein